METDEMAATGDRRLHLDILPVLSGGQVEGDALAGFRELLLPLGPPLLEDKFAIIQYSTNIRNMPITFA